MDILTATMRRRQNPPFHFVTSHPRHHMSFEREETPSGLYTGVDVIKWMNIAVVNCGNSILSRHA